MYRKKGAQIIRHILKSSPKAKYQAIKNIFPHTPVPFYLRMSDDDYLKSLYNELQGGRPIDLNSNNSVNQRGKKVFSFGRDLANQNQQNSSRKQKLLLSQMINEYVLGSERLELYTEIEQLIVLMKPEQVLQEVKNLIYIFKLLRNEKINQRDEEHEFRAKLRQILSDVILAKVNCAQKEMNLQFDRIKLQNAREKLQLWEKIYSARSSIAQGDSEKAKIAYQHVYGNPNATEKNKQQALDYLCQSGIQSKNQLILENIFQTAKERGLTKHMEMITAALNKIRASLQSQDGRKPSQSA